ncbi:ClpXP protease specificity-enhancing factor SspB [Emcibacter sp. SYSU 3D8]|uniref:SspB family protein n=1 Tax=Emcibacter sp. SYSU 3D8 TaxID=3133969 RepID=UPI0031FEEC4C
MTSGQKTSDGGAIDYDALIRSALIGVVRDLLSETVEHGLVGDHHFYLAFSTTHPGVAMPSHLRAQHPKDMTIVLQNQFWDLSVEHDRFMVSLSFNGKMEKLVIPFDALVGFLDPSVQFALQFREVNPGKPAAGTVESDSADDGDPAVESGTDSGNNVIALDIFRKQ